MTAKKTAEPKYRPEHAPALLMELSRASQEGLPAGEILDMANKARHVELRAAIDRYAPHVGSSPRKLSDALKVLVGKEVDYSGEKLTLKSRYVNRKHQTEFCVDGTLRHRIIKARDKANRREADIKETARELAIELRKHGNAAAAVAAVLPTIAEPTTQKPGYYSPVGGSARDVAYEDTLRRGWLPETPPALPPARIAPEPTVVIATPPPAVDMTGWPPAWRKYGKPDYSPKQWETPDPSFKNAEVRANPRPSAAELGNFTLSDAERQQRQSKKWSPM